MGKISVIIPAYNAGKTIAKSLNSILEGEYDNFEIIVVNDGSSDDTEKIVRIIAERDSRVLLYTQKNQGVAAARNTGFKYVTGNYIAWCDADDWVEKDWLLNSYNFLKKYNADIAVCRCKIDDRMVEYDSEKIELWNKHQVINKFLLHKELNGSLCNKLFKKELFEGISFESNLSYFEDDRIFWEILKRVDRVVRYHKEEYHITLREDSLTAQKFNEKRVEALGVWEEIHHECKTKYKQYERSASQILAYQYFCMMLAMYKDCYFDRAVEKRARAIMYKYARPTLVIIDGIAYKTFYIAVLISSKLARTLYNCKKLHDL